MEKIISAPFQLDHIGIAVKSIAEAKAFYLALGFSEPVLEEVKSEKVLTGMLQLKNESRLELLEATESDSPIQKFIDKRGPGIHHICLRVEDIDQVLMDLKAKGVRLINEQAKLGAHGCRVAFVHPSSTGGILLELSENKAEI
jgi:methylmalonyl-CoA/ethylmalonyl-CoA epimerase